MTSFLRISTWSLEKIASAIDGVLLGNRGDSGKTASEIRISGVSSDTRAIEDGALFVALSGENFDAHNFLEKAFELGAVAALVKRGNSVDVAGFAMIEVEDPELAMGMLGHALWKEATDGGLHSIAVTGSNGKTTTKEMLARLWSSVGVVHATRGNLNNQIGLPLTLCALPTRCDYLIVEMGANAAGDIAELIELAPASERIITSIGHAHIEGFGSLDGVRRAKSEIFLNADEKTVAIVPICEVVNVIHETFQGRVLTFGTEENADVRCTVRQVMADGGQLVEVKVNSSKLVVRLPLAGEHNARNLAAACATLVAVGGEKLLGEVLKSGDNFDGFELPGGRWRREKVGKFEIIDDAYNANPSSVRAAFDAFMSIEHAGERIVVLGEMRELGENEAVQLHEEVARYVALTRGLHGFVAVGKYATVMCEAAAAAAAAAAESSDDVGLDVFAAADVCDAGAWLLSRESALVFLKGSRGSRLERIVEILRSSQEPTMG